ncbi:MAG: hypothetical protein OJF51_002017 [Nitrospira sp.]|nr:MAG: hypothetical protein OJF51_002017 [Nitrospira sp.]
MAPGLFSLAISTTNGLANHSGCIYPQELLLLLSKAEFELIDQSETSESLKQIWVCRTMS